LTAETVAALGTDARPPLTAYTVAEKDVAGPFGTIPSDMMERAKLEHLPYETPVEALSERFHLSPRALRALNPGRRFVAGDVLNVPDVDAPKVQDKGLRVAIEKKKRLLRVVTRDDKTVAAFPISLGGERDIIEVGQYKIANEVKNPDFAYDPELIHGAKPHYTKAKIAPGPNNPVGVVWLGLSKPHYGIHGTPEPSRVGHEETNGCVHLTNWDAQRLAALVSPGTVVDVRE
ncbi:MAG: L,D-transpeptidase, partial [Betaproteobacteria bacterium]